MRKIWHLALSLPLVLQPGAARPAEAPQATVVSVPEIVSGQAAERMDALLTRAAGLGFSGQALVELDGRVVLHRAYGWADRAHLRAMTTRTGIGIASISKHVTATAVLRLRDQGRLALDAPIADYLPGVPDDKAGITVAQLLSHSGGIRGGDVGGDFEMADREDLLRRIFAEAPRSAPGERWSYANAGYSLLAAIVEATSGMPFEAFVQQEIFGPAGMQDSGFWHTTQLPAERLSHAYMGWQDQGSPAGWPRNWRVYGSGDVISTAADLYRLDLALRARTILSRRGWREATTQQTKVSDTVGYGYGLFVVQGEGGRVLEHGGDWQRGYNGLFMRYVDEGIVLIITCNARDHQGNWLRHAVGAELESLARGNAPKLLLPDVAPMPPRMRTQLPGSYWLADGSRFEVIDDGASLWIGAEGQAAADLLTGADPEARAATARGTSRTRRLLAALLRNDDGYREALGDVPPELYDDYRSEWDGLVERRGPLQDFQLLGSVLQRDRVVTSATLDFGSGRSVYMLYTWSDRAEGRLAGTFIRPGWFPAALPVAIPLVALTDGLSAHDLYAERGVPVQVVRDAGVISGFAIAGVPAVRRSPHAPVDWSPTEPFLQEAER